MSQEVGEEIGSKIGRFIEVDRRLWQSNHAKFMRVCVDLEIDKPLRRGAYITSSDGERLWLSFRYERLPTVCFICGKLGHDNKHCPMSKDWRSVCPQYGDWLRAGWTTKETGKEKYSSKEKNRGVSAEQGIQEMVWPMTGSSSEGFWVRGLEGGNTSIEKGIIGEGGNITRVDGQLPGNVQAISDVSE